MDFQIQNFKAPAPRLSPDGITAIPDASSVLPDSLVAQGLTTMPDDPPFASFGGGFFQTEPDQNFPSGSDSFVISINGTTNSEGAQSSPFTINCTGGEGKYASGSFGSTPQEVDFSDATGESASPPSSGVSFWRVYAKTTAQKQTGGHFDVSGTGSVEIDSAASGFVAGSNTRYEYNTGGEYFIYFLIGSVAAVKRSDGLYQVKINQVQVGNYDSGKSKSGSVTIDGTQISTADGLREFTICINGSPFTCDLEVSNIEQVT